MFHSGLEIARTPETTVEDIIPNLKPGLRASVLCNMSLSVLLRTYPQTYLSSQYLHFWVYILQQPSALMVLRIGSIDQDQRSAAVHGTMSYRISSNYQLCETFPLRNSLAAVHSQVHEVALFPLNPSPTPSSLSLAVH